jgi:hypothetical protein
MPFSIPFRYSSFRSLVMLSVVATAIAGSGCQGIADDAAGEIIGGIIDDLCKNTPPVGKVIIDSRSLSLRPGQVVQVGAATQTSSGSPDLCLPAATWTSSNPGVVTVSETAPRYFIGAQGIAAGTAFIRASAGGITDSIPVTVVNTAIASLVIDGPSSLLVARAAARSTLPTDTIEKPGVVSDLRRVSMMADQLSTRGLRSRMKAPTISQAGVTLLSES